MSSKIDTIAVFTDGNGDPADFYSAFALCVYHYEEGWHKLSDMSLSPVTAKTVAQIRAEAFDRKALISNCRAVAAKALSGIPYSVFDMAGYSIFTIDDLSDDTLDAIAQDISQVEEADQINIKSIVVHVEAGGDGYYYFDLSALQAEHPEVSSKMALKEFLETTPFMELVVKCSHVPPWIEKSGAYEIKCIIGKDETIASIRKKRC